MTSRLKKASYTTIVGLGLFAGPAGMTAAASGGSTPAPTPPAQSVNRDNRTPDEADNPAEADDANDGVDCEDGNDVAESDEGDEADGADREDGNDVAESDEAEADEGDEADGVDCEDGIEAATGAECDGGPAANQDNDPNEPAGVQDANG